MGRTDIAKDKYLNFISYSEFLLWDVKQYVKSSLDYRYLSTNLGAVLSKTDSDWVRIEDDERYPILGVRAQGKGVYINREVLGKELTMKKYQKSKTYHLFYCKVRTVKGQWGVVYPSFESSFGSTNMQYLKIDLDKLKPEYLEQLLKLKRITDVWDTNASGADGRHFRLDILLSLIIPLPPLKEQNSLVKSYNQKIHLAHQQEFKAKELEKDIENYLFEVLCIDKLEEKESKKGLHFVQFNFVERWAVDFLNTASKISKELKGKYELVKLRDFITSYQYGLSEKSSKDNIGPPMLRMNNIYDSEIIVDNLKYINIDDSVKNKYLLNKGDLLFNRTNSKELVGKTGVFNEKGEYTFASYLIRVVINSSKADVNYINFLFNSSLLKYQKDMISRQITGQANINAQEMQDFLFPLPPLQIQDEIVATIEQMKSKIKTLQQQAKENRKLAIEEFEKAIFQ